MKSKTEARKKGRASTDLVIPEITHIIAIPHHLVFGNYSPRSPHYLSVSIFRTFRSADLIMFFELLHRLATLCTTIGSRRNRTPTFHVLHHSISFCDAVSVWILYEYMTKAKTRPLAWYSMVRLKEALLRLANRRLPGDNQTMHEQSKVPNNGRSKPVSVGLSAYIIRANSK
jgi:hypothetical protein